jgi:hypothetical protein
MARRRRQLRIILYSEPTYKPLVVRFVLLCTSLQYRLLTETQQNKASYFRFDEALFFFFRSNYFQTINTKKTELTSKTFSQKRHE